MMVERVLEVMVELLVEGRIRLRRNRIMGVGRKRGFGSFGSGSEVGGEKFSF